MNVEMFDELVTSYVELETRLEEETALTPPRPGAWLVDLLGVSLTCVGLAYDDAVWALRFLKRVDTRSSDEMFAWDRRSARAWLRRNKRVVPSNLANAVAAALESGQTLDDSVWRAVVNGLDWTNIGPWGPGDPTTGDRLRRLQALYVLTSLISHEMGRHATFNFVIGSNRELGGDSPLLLVARFGPARFEDALQAAERYLAADGSHA